MHSSSANVHGVQQSSSSWRALAFSQIALSLMLSPESCFSFIHSRSSFSTSFRISGRFFLDVIKDLTHQIPWSSTSSSLWWKWWRNPSPTHGQCLSFVPFPRIYGCFSSSSPWWWAPSLVQVPFTQAQWIENQMNTKHRSHTNQRSACPRCSLWGRQTKVTWAERNLWDACLVKPGQAGMYWINISSHK